MFDSMTLKILLPYQVFLEKDNVKKVIIETKGGSFGMLPNRLDCVVALVPGILVYETEASEEVYVAIDEGIFVKAGNHIFVSVRNAFGGAKLGALKTQLEHEFLNLDEREINVKSVMTKLESEFVRRYVGSRHE